MANTGCKQRFGRSNLHLLARRLNIYRFQFLSQAFTKGYKNMQAQSAWQEVLLGGASTVTDSGLLFVCEVIRFSADMWISQRQFA